MSATDPHHALHRTIEAVWRIESARVIAGLTRLTRDLDLAEDLAQEALLAALEQWPQSGVPETGFENYIGGNVEFDGVLAEREFVER